MAGTITECLRAWRAAPDDPRALQRLEESCARAGQPIPYEALAATPRWRWLREQVEVFYSEPLRESDGLSSEAIAACEAASPHPIPALLKEWHRLVGARLASERLTIYELAAATSLFEDGVWICGDGSLDACAFIDWSGCAAPDPLVELTYQDDLLSRLPLSQFLRGLTAMESLYAVRDGQREGPLGAFAEGIDGGVEAAPEDAPWLESLPLLLDEPWWLGAYEDMALRGTERVLVAAGDEELLWLAPLEAVPRFEDRFPPPERWHVRVRLRGSSVDEVLTLCRRDGIRELMDEAAAFVGWQPQPSDGVLILLETTDPGGACERLCDQLAGQIGALHEVTARARRVNRIRDSWRWPPGSTA